MTREDLKEKFKVGDRVVFTNEAFYEGIECAPLNSHYGSTVGKTYTVSRMAHVLYFKNDQRHVHSLQGEV